MDTTQPTHSARTVKPLPCPFCGKVPKMFPSGDRTGIMIQCVTTACLQPHVSYYGNGVTLRKWNTRAVTEREQKMRKALKKMVGVPQREGREGG